MTVSEIDRLIQLLARLPGLGPRSARRAALKMIQKPETLMLPLAAALQRTAENIHACSTCGNLDASDPCAICRDPAHHFSGSAYPTGVVIGTPRGSSLIVPGNHFSRKTGGLGYIYIFPNR